MKSGYKWHKRFMDLAEHVAQWSKDPSTKVGAVLVNYNRIVIGVGYNGFPRGVEDTEERYADRPTKYALVVHAEMNAIANATESVKGSTLYVTLAPCNECMKMIAQHGITTIFSPPRDPARDTINGGSFAEIIAREAKIHHIIIGPLPNAPSGVVK
jgi:dCMP deaminase